MLAGLFCVSSDCKVHGFGQQMDILVLKAVENISP
jgi:hypothetical protein